MAMFPFPFGKKLEINKEYSIEEIPLFSHLSPSEIKLIEKKIRLSEYKKNDIIYEQGTEPEAFYIVCAGRFRVFVRSPYGTERTITYLYRGDYFGEISILTGKTHSVTVEAINDSLVLKLSKEDFNELLMHVPSLALHLSRSLGLKLRDESKERIGEAKIVSVYSLKQSVGQTTFAVSLSLRLQKEIKKPVLYVDMTQDGKGFKELREPGLSDLALDLVEFESNKEILLDKFIHDTRSGVKILRVQNGEGKKIQEKRLMALLSYLISHANYVIVDLPREINEVVLKVLTQSDEIYVITDGEKKEIEKCGSLIAEMKNSFTFEEQQIKLIFAESNKELHLSTAEIEKIAGHKVFSFLPYAPEIEENEKKAAPLILRDSQSPYARTIGYLARELCGKLVGLVLGSGAAHGFAHVGVIKVLEQNNIPVDVIAGSSMGALVGALWAAGYSAEEIEKISLSLDKKNSFINLIGFSDFSIAHQGFFKGRMIVRYLRSLLGQKMFRDLKIPLKIVATNLFTAEEIVFEEGDVVEAIRASVSIPGIFRPFRINGKTLIDGGVIDPVPVKVLARMGVRKIIAVNVLSGPADLLKRREMLKQRAAQTEEKLNRSGPLERWFFKVKKKLGKRYSTNIFNVLMNTIQFMEYSIASTATAEADIVIHPVISDANWIEFYAAEKFIKVGEEKTREQLQEIQKLIEQ